HERVPAELESPAYRGEFGPAEMAASAFLTGLTGKAWHRLRKDRRQEQPGRKHSAESAWTPAQCHHFLTPRRLVKTGNSATLAFAGITNLQQVRLTKQRSSVRYSSSKAMGFDACSSNLPTPRIARA
ncbi:MAG TPA: hypothetical protein VN326_10775, partial [Casimicrobiaceae bacterium]|nr:hypothetical protein [Casimicrobiaceae bacterium]